MKYAFAIISALILCLVIYLAQAFSEYREVQFRVYDVENKYALTQEGADLMIVDFSRFGCDHCRKLHPVLKEAIERDGKIRYMPRLVTFDKVWDETLATSVYAAAEQGKFVEMHHAIFKNWPVESRKKLYQTAASIELNIEKFDQDLKDPEIIDRMREDQKYFESWMLSRTPSILVGKSMIFQPMDKETTVEELLEKFNEIRK